MDADHHGDSRVIGDSSALDLYITIEYLRNSTSSVMERAARFREIILIDPCLNLKPSLRSTQIIREDLIVKEFSDDDMREMISTTKSYCIVVLKGGPKRNDPGADKIVWEHVRRNFLLRAEGKLAIVCPIKDGSDVHGVGIFTTSVEETKIIMDEDPGVKAGIFTYELHPCRSFPGDRLPE